MVEKAGQTVRNLRQRLGMTREEFARRIQVTLSTVNRWENGHATPSHLAWRAIEDLAKRQGADDELLGRTVLMAGAL
ncbi:MAG: helix-turn-helix transcriptional regulator [Deltaproteobacteria bacterium]|nr:MAG: helix-turn-helix transcriptional regulator [Deltaproteobacteria bacterium]